MRVLTQDILGNQRWNGRTRQYESMPTSTFHDMLDGAAAIVERAAGAVNWPRLLFEAASRHMLLHPDRLVEDDRQHPSPVADLCGECFREAILADDTGAQDWTARPASPREHRGTDWPAIVAAVLPHRAAAHWHSFQNYPVPAPHHLSSLLQESSMPVARYALQYAAQLAQFLGSGWSASGCDSSTFAVLNGPDIELAVSTTSPIQSRTKVRVEVRSRGDLVWPRRADYYGQVSGTIGDPAAVADVIRTEVLPAWTKLVTELEARTERSRAAIREFAPLAAEAVGDGASVTYGSRPGVAVIRWDGGRAVLWASDEGRISSPSIEITSARSSAIVLALLRTAAGPVPDTTQFSVSDAARLLGDGPVATSWSRGATARASSTGTASARVRPCR
ncbi:hypothetical protein ACIREO_22380 [Streptomyces sp. NPDC102441]|uniref:hypothetical protein n=1 Tax=Streptomyces sp. NPDC102441 TaxID=3366176 RepID=UPI00381E6828